MYGLGYSHYGYGFGVCYRYGSDFSIYGFGFRCGYGNGCGLCLGLWCWKNLFFISFKKKDNC